MNANNQKILENFGVDIPKTVARFGGNERLMLSFMRELREDETMPQVRAAHDSNDRSALFASVHSMKGLAGGMGFTKLYDIASKMMDAFRANQDDEAERLYPSLCEEFERTASVTDQLTD